MRSRFLVTFAFFALLLVSASIAFAGKDYRAERFDADWYIQKDGSLVISETVAFNFSGGPFTYVYRELPQNYSDGVEVLDVSMDGDRLTPGSAAGQFEVSDNGDKKVTWHFAPTSDQTHTFGIVYQVHGAIRREGGQDLLLWNFLPTDYGYPIASATLNVAYPYDAQRIGPPEVRRGEASVSEGTGLTVFTSSNIRKNSPLTVALRFAAGSLITESPAWQQHAAQVAQRAPTMWLLAAFVLAVGTVFLSLAWRTGQRSGPLPEPRTMVRTAPPSNLPPALAGALVNYGGKASTVQAMASLFSLAQRGVVTFEQTGEKKWYQEAQFAVRLQRGVLETMPLELHDEALITGLFKDRDEVALTQMGRRLRTAMKPFGKAVSAQLVGLGLIDPKRSAFATRMMVVGGVLLALMVPAFVAAALLGSAYGGWVLLIPAAVFILSMIAFLMGAAYSARSVRGEEEAAEWRSFRDYIKGVTKGREPAWDLALFDRYFAYAATFDLAQGWAKAFRDRGGTEVPAWFRTLSADGDRMGAFVVLAATSHSAGSPSGGAGSGGAGGGGGSGAG